MATSNPIFFKEIPLQVKTQGNFYLVYLATGFSKPVDPLSGMTVNLMSVMSWQNDFKASLAKQDFSSWLEFLKSASAFFSEKASSEKAELKALQLRFFDGRILRQDLEGLYLFENFPYEHQGKVMIAKSKIKVQSEADLSKSFPQPFEAYDPETKITISLTSNGEG